MKTSKTINPIVLLWILYITAAMLPAYAEPPSVNVKSLIPPVLLLDDATVAAIQKCQVDEHDFTQRYTALIADDQALQQEASAIEKYKDNIEASQQNLNQEEINLNNLAHTQTKMSADLDILRNGLHRNHATQPLSNAEMQQENVKIQAYNTMSGEFNVMTDQYNKQVLLQKRRIADHNALVKKLNETVARYNEHAQAFQGPLNKVIADVGYYQHKCAADLKK